MKLSLTDLQVRAACIAFCEPVYGYKNFEPNERAMEAMRSVLENITEFALAQQASGSRTDYQNGHADGVDDGMALAQQAQPEPSSAKTFDEWFGPGDGEGRFEYGGDNPIRTAAWLAWCAALGFRERT